MGNLEDRIQQGTPDTDKPVLNLLFIFLCESNIITGKQIHVLHLKSKLDGVLYVIFVHYVTHILYILCTANTSSIIM